MKGNLSRHLLEALAAGADRKLSFYGYDGLLEQHSFVDLEKASRDRAQVLANLGVGEGRTVALLGTTSFDLVSSVLAVWLCGAAVTVLPTPTRLLRLDLYLTETMRKLGRAEVDLLLGEGELVMPFEGSSRSGVCDWNQLADAPSLTLGEGNGRAEVGLVQFSSGTTREPQPILISFEALLANSLAVLQQFPGSAEQHSLVSWLPLYHDMGLIGGLLMPLLAPGSLTLMAPEVFAVRPAVWLQAISEQRATTSSAPNFALAHAADRTSEEELAKLDLSCWTIAMLGAEPIRPQTLERFAQRFAPVGFRSQAFSPVYGLAEATLAVTFSPLGEGVKLASIDSEHLAESGEVREGAGRAVSVGRPLAGVEIEVRDQEGSPLGEARLGEVWVRGQSLLDGVLVDGVVEKTTEQGWLPTGDLGFLMDGELYLYGRRRDILLIDGRNHDPALLEEPVERMPATRRCCAFMAIGDESQDQDTLVLVCEVGRDWNGSLGDFEAEVFAVCKEQAPTLRPKRVLMVEAGSLPVTSSGKLRRSETARLYQVGQLCALETTGPSKSL